MSDAITPLELREAVRPVLTDLRQDTWPIPEEQGRGFDAELWSQGAELGWFQLAIPEEAEGLGLGIEHMAVLHEELGRALGSVPFLPTVLATQVIADKLGSDAGAELLQQIAAGELRAAIALPTTDASLKRDGNMLSGRVSDVLFADVAEMLLLPIADGKSLVIVPAHTVSVAVEKRALVDLTRSSADVVVTNLDASACIVIEMEPADWDRLLDHAAIALAAEAVGATQAIFEVTLAYLNTREQFGRLIGSFQALKHRMADWKCRLEVAAALVRSAPALMASGIAEGSAAASGAKAYCCDTFAGFAADAIQLHGGIGFTWEHPCHLFLKRAKLNQQLFGSSAFHKDRVARLAFARSAPTSDDLTRLT